MELQVSNRKSVGFGGFYTKLGKDRWSLMLLSVFHIDKSRGLGSQGWFGSARSSTGSFHQNQEESLCVGETKMGRKGGRGARGAQAQKCATEWGVLRAAGVSCAWLAQKPCPFHSGLLVLHVADRSQGSARLSVTT